MLPGPAAAAAALSGAAPRPVWEAAVAAGRGTAVWTHIPTLHEQHVQQTADSNTSVSKNIVCVNVELNSVNAAV